MRGSRPASLAPILLLSFLATFGTAVLWNGLAFIAKEAYGFDESWNLALAIFNGAVYAIAAFGSGPILARISANVAPRTVIAIVFIGQVALCPLVLVGEHPGLLFLVSGGMSAFAAFFWPLIENYVAAGRSPRGMRHAIGWWNGTWMTALGIALIAIAPFLAAGHASWAIVALAPLNLLCLGILAIGLPPHPPTHEGADPANDHPAVYRDLLATHRALLPLGYALIGALSPLMPYLLEDLDAPLAWQTPLTATWMFARVGGIMLLRGIEGWHGRWWMASLGAALLVGGFVATVLAGSLAAIVVGLVVFGLGQAAVYYAALYYVMRVGDADVDAASTHEGLIGVGYAAGPSAAAFGVAIGGGTAAIAGATLVLPLLAAWPALRPWLAHRSR